MYLVSCLYFIFFEKSPKLAIVNEKIHKCSQSHFSAFSIDLPCLG